MIVFHKLCRITAFITVRPVSVRLCISDLQPKPWLTCVYWQDNQVPVCPLCNCPVPLGMAGALTCMCLTYLCWQDNQVPVCPLCNCPVPLGTAGALPDEVVGRHIDNDCQSETAQSRRKVRQHLIMFLWHLLIACIHIYQCYAVRTWFEFVQLELDLNLFTFIKLNVWFTVYSRKYVLILWRQVLCRM